MGKFSHINTYILQTKNLANKNSVISIHTLIKEASILTRFLKYITISMLQQMDSNNILLLTFHLRK